MSRTDDCSPRAGRTCLAYPLDYVITCVAGIGRMFSPDHVVIPEMTGLDRGGMAWRALVSIGWAQLAIVYALALVGTAAAWRQSPIAAAVPLALLAYFLAVSGPEMYPRFRVPLMPAVCLLAGAGLQAIWRRRRTS